MAHKFIIFLFTLSWALFAETVDAQAQYKVFYYPDGQTKSSEGTMLNGKPDGYWKTYYQNGLLKSEGNRVNHQLDGIWKFYREDATLERTISYAADMKNGVEQLFSKQEILLEEYTYVNNIKEGSARMYYDTGELMKTLNFVNNKEEGKAIEYDKDGRVITIITYKNGFIYASEKINRYNSAGKRTGIWRDLFDNGMLKEEGNYTNGLRNGVFKFFDQKGGLIKMEKYLDGVLQSDDGESAILDIRQEYYDDGTLKTMGSYKEGKKHGTFRAYDQQGKEIAGMLYENDMRIGEGQLDSLGRRIGSWKIYYPTSEIRAEGAYDAGLKEGVWKYYIANGKTEQTGVYKADLPTGQWRWYYSDGSLHRDEFYRKGREDGHAVEYDTLGNAINEGDYTDGVKTGKWKLTINDHTEEGEYQDGEKHGVWLWYYDNAQRAFEGEFTAGVPTGRHRYWYRNGQLKMKGSYQGGELHGKWEYYDENGTLELLMEYDMGVAIKINGQKIKLPKSNNEDN